MHREKKDGRKKQQDEGGKKEKIQRGKSGVSRGNGTEEKKNEVRGKKRKGTERKQVRQGQRERKSKRRAITPVWIRFLSSLMGQRYMHKKHTC